MKKIKTILSIFLILSCGTSAANLEEIEKLAPDMREAQILVETRSFLKGLYEQRNKGIKIDKKEALAVAAKVEQIATHGCECEDLEQENMLGGQAYALAAGIYGILSKDSKDIMLGRKSYHGLIKARELDPNNIDAIKGQAIALNMILAKGWVVSKIAAVVLGINLVDAQRELVHDLRGFPDRKDLQRLADELEDNI